MIVFPPCKINLGLSVLKKRPDNYHELETIFLQLPFCDILEIISAPEFSFRSSGLSIDGRSENNLCVKAYYMLKKDFDLSPVSIHLHKQIPMGAGLGGGSSDGTYTLILLNRLFDLNLSEEQLRNYALELGSDCPLFVSSKAQLGLGRGEILSPVDLDLSGFYIQLINTGIHVSTQEAFRDLDIKAKSPQSSKIKLSEIETWKNFLVNDFEVPVFNRYPELRKLKEELYQNGALYASMTGTGSTLFGIFRSEPKKIAAVSKKNYFDKTTFMV